MNTESKAAASVRRNFAGRLPPCFTLQLSNIDRLWRACSRLIAAEEVFVPSDKALPIGSRIELVLATDTLRSPSMRGRVLRVDPEGPRGFQVHVFPNPEFREFFSQGVRQRRIDKRAHRHTGKR